MNTQKTKRKKLLIVLISVSLIFIGIAQAAVYNKKPRHLPVTIKTAAKMKDYVFILWIKPITPEVLAIVGPKWKALIPKWAASGHYIGNATMMNDATLITGKSRTISHEPINHNGRIVLDVLRMRAKDMQEALELAKQCPTLDVDGYVEVHEGVMLPGSPESN